MVVNTPGLYPPCKIIKSYIEASMDQQEGASHETLPLVT